MKQINENLIPNTVNPSPDYYCTWQTQLYATCDGKPAAQRAVIGERALFDSERPFGWAYFYPEVRSDLILVMDDSWDVPPSNDPDYYGSLILDRAKFPRAWETAQSNAEALGNLVDRVRTLGWKGVGGWVCAQRSEKRSGYETVEDYWLACLREAHASGFAYWKVDWGRSAKDSAFRRMLTDQGHAHAPALVIEHAVTPQSIPYFDVFRTYDVPAIFSIPMTMEKLKDVLFVGTVQEGYAGLINCEDEAYMAAAGGFIMGIMRHPYNGDFVNGQPDPSFPSTHRNLKTKIYEVVRAARWHRIAPAFGVDCAHVQVSQTVLEDTWRFVDRESEIETWWLSNPLICDHMVDGLVTLRAPAAIARNCELPCVEPDEKGQIPYVVAAKNPNGAFSVATLGRTRERDYHIPLCRVEVDVHDASIIGVFGDYATLTVHTDGTQIIAVLAQDLAADRAWDITEDVKISENCITLTGDLIRRIGCFAQPDGDTSEPGIVLRIVRADA
jgi:hypothetical protein